MFDDRTFAETYDLYRPTRAVSGSGRQVVYEPDDATASDQPCLFFDSPMQAFSQTRFGVEITPDAVMLIPYSATLYPIARGDAPDHVVVDSRRFVVRAVYDAAGRGLYKVALLEERRSAP